MEKRRIDDLFEYLSTLGYLNDDGFACVREISECIDAIREELALGEFKEPRDASKTVTDAIMRAYK